MADDMPRSVRLPDELWRWIRVHAAETDRSTGEVVRQAVTEYRAKIESAKKAPRRRQS